MDEMTNNLPGFGTTLTEVEEAIGSSRALERDGRICACGHPMGRHTETDLTEYGRGVTRRCEPIRISEGCACTDWKPVIEVSDTRPFLRKTRGHGPMHALLGGLRGLVSKEGRTYEWMDGWPRCELSAWDEGGLACEQAAGVDPYGFAPSGLAVSENPAYTFLLCRAHGLAAIENGFPRREESA